MKVYILYYQFIDDPSVLLGIYSTAEKAEAAAVTWGSPYGMQTYIIEVELDVNQDGDGLQLA